MTFLCKYHNLFGEPDKGVHSYRFFGFALVDTVMTVIGALVLYKIFGNGRDAWAWLLGLFLVGIVVHRLFCVNTALNVKLFGPVKTE